MGGFPGNPTLESGPSWLLPSNNWLAKSQGGDHPSAIMLGILYEEVSVAVPLLNYTTKIPAEQTAAEIMSILVKKGATEILTHYGPGGMATGLKWRMETANGPMGLLAPHQR